MSFESKLNIVGLLCESYGLYESYGADFNGRQVSTGCTGKGDVIPVSMAPGGKIALDVVIAFSEIYQSS